MVTVSRSGPGPGPRRGDFSGTRLTGRLGVSARAVRASVPCSQSRVAAAGRCRRGWAGAVAAVRRHGWRPGPKPKPRAGVARAATHWQPWATRARDRVWPAQSDRDGGLVTVTDRG
jgi:hypothetical protein